MATSLANEYQSILIAVRTWPPELRLSFAEEVLRTLHEVVGQKRKRGVPVEQVLGIGASSGPPPDDDTVKRWIEEHRVEKYG